MLTLWPRFDDVNVHRFQHRLLLFCCRWLVSAASQSRNLSFTAAAAAAAATVVVAAMAAVVVAVVVMEVLVAVTCSHSMPTAQRLPTLMQCSMAKPTLTLRPPLPALGVKH